MMSHGRGLIIPCVATLSLPPGRGCHSRAQRCRYRNIVQKNWWPGVYLENFLFGLDTPPSNVALVCWYVLSRVCLNLANLVWSVLYSIVVDNTSLVASFFSALLSSDINNLLIQSPVNASAPPHPVLAFQFVPKGGGLWIHWPRLMDVPRPASRRY